jgi:hypothetical protein
MAVPPYRLFGFRKSEGFCGMKIRISCIIFIIMLLALCPARKAPAQIPGFGMDEGMKEMFLRAIPPYIGVVYCEPEMPEAGKDVTVTASVAAIPFSEEVENSVDEVTLFYSTNGGETWEQLDMEQTEDNEELWSAAIPGQDAGTTVDYYVKAVSGAGSLDISFNKAPMSANINLDIGISQFLEVPAVLNTTAADAAGEPESLFEKLPLIAQEEATDDDIAPEANLQALRFACDGNNCYVRLNFAKKINGGQMSPLHGRAYLGAFLNLYKDFDEWDARDVSMADYVEKIKSIMPINDTSAMAREGADRLAAWLWAPLAAALPFGVPKEAIIKLNPNNMSKPNFDTQSVTSVVRDDGNVDLTIKRKVLGPDTDTFMLLFADVEASGSLDSIAVDIPDISYPTIVRFTDRHFTVGE